MVASVSAKMIKFWGAFHNIPVPFPSFKRSFKLLWNGFFFNYSVTVFQVHFPSNRINIVRRGVSTQYLFLWRRCSYAKKFDYFIFPKAVVNHQNSLHHQWFMLYEKFFFNYCFSIFLTFRPETEAYIPVKNQEAEPSDIPKNAQLFPKPQGSVLMMSFTWQNTGGKWSRSKAGAL